MKTHWILAVILALLISDRACGWLAHLYHDEEIVKRAELIVLARIKEGSIKKILHPGSYEHSAVLIVSRAIKGQFHEKELPIRIAYGLLPLTASQAKKILPKEMLPPEDATPQAATERAGEWTKIYEDNPGMGLFRPSSDVHQDQLWALHHYPSSGRGAADRFGITNPEDIQPAIKEKDLAKLVRKQ